MVSSRGVTGTRTGHGKKVIKGPSHDQPFPSLLSSLPATQGKRLLRPPVPRATCYLANRRWIPPDSTVLRLYFLLSRPPAEARARWKQRWDLIFAVPFVSDETRVPEFWSIPWIIDAIILSSNAFSVIYFVDSCLWIFSSGDWIMTRGTKERKVPWAIGFWERVYLLFISGNCGH